jgi:ribose-phosphate pyrophosphokinase
VSDNTGTGYRAGGPRPPAEKRLLLFGGRAYPELAEEIAGCLGIQTTPTKISDFANGEIFVRSLESVRGCDAFVLQSHTSPINQWIMEQLIMVRSAHHGRHALLRVRAAG